MRFLLFSLHCFVGRKLEILIMRNLKLEDVKEESLLFAAGPRQICCGFDGESEKGFVFTFGDNLELTKHNFSEGKCWTTVPACSKIADVEVVNATHLTWSNKVAIGLTNGDIWTVEGDNGYWVNEGILPDEGLQAMEWSPDQELVVLVSNENKMVLMSRAFDPLVECSLSDDSFGEKGFVTVGWGKKETQFHGSEGKQAATAKVEVVPDNTYTGVSTTRITWRGDGQLYAVGFIMDGFFRFKVFDKEGQLQYTSEKHAGLERNLAWRPSGNVIATTQKLPNKYIVAFFEKNGLKHGEFTIPVLSDTVVEGISWSTDSEILALQCLNTNESKQSVLLFTSSNYHWYLKQTLHFSADQTIIGVLWDNWDLTLNSSKTLHVFSAEGKHYTYRWNWKIDHSAGRDSSDDSVVGVIAGSKLLVTAFRHAVVPPPMAALQLNTASTIMSIFFGSKLKSSKNMQWNSNDFCVVTDNDEITFYKQISKVPLKYEMIGSTVLTGSDFPFNRYNWQWLSDDIIICVKVKNSNYYIEEYMLEVTNMNIRLELQHSTLMNVEGVLALQQHPNNVSNIFLLSQYNMFDYSVGGNLEQIPGNIVHPKDSTFHVFNVDEKLYFLLMGSASTLRIYNITSGGLKEHSCIANVNSVFIQTDFLLLTTLEHELLCLELMTNAMEELSNSSKPASCSRLYKRKIERGAKLVIVVPQDTRTVLQMPRGNLEAIQPRPLSLKIIGQYLDELKYFEAFDLMRKQRINLNLIYDHNPDKLIKNVDRFLNDIKNPSWLSLFLTELENVDVTKTMYISSYTDRAAELNQDVTSKVSSVCELIRSYLDKRDDREKKILPILTSYVKKNTIEDLESALLIVKELKKKENNSHKLSVGSDEALKYLLYLVDVNYLYDIAMGMYDFELVLLVASKSQKDPKEYVPLLNELNKMEENLKRFSINKELKRFSRAVECLAKCGPSRHDELRSFVKYHSLFREALALFQSHEEVYRQISDDFGLHLKLKKNFTEAGFVYQRGGKIDKAVECFKEALEWEFAIQLAQSWDTEKFRDLCLQLVAALKQEKRHCEALTILEQCNDNLPDIILYAAECGQYKTALRISQIHGELELKDNVILPAIKEEQSNLMTTVNSNLDTFKKYKQRLVIVRTNTKLNPEETYDSNYLHKDSDLYSDAGSTIASSTSRGSSRTFRSSKNKRKHERKLISLKEGSRYEEVALVIALHGLVTSSFELRNRVKEVNLALCHFGSDKDAENLQARLEILLKEMKDSFKQIWTNEFVLEATNASISAQLDTEGTPQGIAALDAHLRIAPVVQEMNWKLIGLGYT